MTELAQNCCLSNLHALGPWLCPSSLPPGPAGPLCHCPWMPTHWPSPCSRCCWTELGALWLCWDCPQRRPLVWEPEPAAWVRLCHSPITSPRDSRLSKHPASGPLLGGSSYLFVGENWDQADKGVQWGWQDRKETQRGEVAQEEKEHNEKAVV